MIAVFNKKQWLQILRVFFLKNQVNIDIFLFAYFIGIYFFRFIVDTVDTVKKH